MNITRFSRMQPLGCVALALLVAASALGQSVNQITAVSPTSAAQGASGLTVTFTLDTDSPPAPPAGIIIQTRAASP